MVIDLLFIRGEFAEKVISNQAQVNQTKRERERDVLAWTACNLKY